MSRPYNPVREKARKVNIPYQRNDVRIATRDIHNGNKKIAIIRSPKLLKHDTVLLLDNFDHIKRKLIEELDKLGDDFFLMVKPVFEDEEDEEKWDGTLELSREQVYLGIKSWVFF